ncbi:ABC-type sugar transport system, periplasmic component [Piscirickettsia salmonis]|nr:ABC-type sugar transport system, periplasmic component [Piscirickettsia salmonis]QGP59973.1 ABC-type sugar transport system, periplasmic component [Piscirickettsia salmonis]QGP63711.1 ABC-type sugar transport system, periplasmic component [Piscirickettsia salmonis]
MLKTRADVVATLEHAKNQGIPADLTGWNLECQDLSGLNLAHAILNDANLKGANLTNCTLTCISTERANLSGANLTRHDFRTLIFRSLLISFV